MVDFEDPPHAFISSALAQVRFQFPWVEVLLIGNNVEYLLLCAGERSPFFSGMEKLPGRHRHEPIGVEVVLFELERAIVPIQVAGPVVDDAMTQNQILSLAPGNEWGRLE